MILDDLIEQTLKVLLPSFLLVKYLEFAGQLFDSIVFVLHLDEIVESLELVVPFIAADDRLAIEEHLDDISLSETSVTLCLKIVLMVPTSLHWIWLDLARNCSMSISEYSPYSDASILKSRLYNYNIWPCTIADCS